MLFFFFFFKQKTAYEIYQCDWSSDVCSSDLREKLTEKAKIELEDYVEKAVKENEEKFVKFFNEAQAINTRLHQFELLPGLGKRHTIAIINAREDGEFKSFDDIRERVQNLPSPEKLIAKRIIKELTEIQRHNLFIS